MTDTAQIEQPPDLADAYRDQLIAAIDRYEAALARHKAAAIPDDQREQRQGLARAARHDVFSMEHALAYRLSELHNHVAPEHLRVDEESDESIGQGVVYRGIAYSLRDVAGNMDDGIIARVELRRMAPLDGPSLPGPTDAVEHASGHVVEADGPPDEGAIRDTIGNGDPTTREELIYQATVRAVARHHEAIRWQKIAYALNTAKASNPWAVQASHQSCDAEGELVRRFSLTATSSTRLTSPAPATSNGSRVASGSMAGSTWPSRIPTTKVNRTRIRATGG